MGIIKVGKVIIILGGGRGMVQVGLGEKRSDVGVGGNI